MTASLIIKEGRFVDREGRVVPPRFGDPGQCALLRRIEKWFECPELEITTDSERRYAAFCEWVCPKCASKQENSTDYEYEGEDEAKEALRHHWVCSGCRARFEVFSETGTLRIREREKGSSR